MQGTTVGRLGLWSMVAALTVAGAGCRTALGQAVQTADTPAGISVFGAGSRVFTDYSHNDYGLTAGADYTRFFHWVQPGLEARYTFSHGDVVAEDSFAGGIKVATSYRRFHPYGDFLLGYGVIHFHPGLPGYTEDNSVFHDFGLGLDYTLNQHLSVKVDGQYQYWRLGTEVHELEPYNVSVGLVYRLAGGFARHPKTVESSRMY